METKQCSKCGEIKEISKFRAAKTRNGTFQVRHQCKECERKSSLKYEEANREKRRQEKRDFYKENLEKELQRKREFYVANTDKEKARAAAWRKANREYLREKDRKHAKANPAYFVYKTQKRHTAKLKRTPPWLTEDHFNQIKTEYELAAWCSEVMGEKYNVDHIVPLRGKTVSGLHVPWNLQVIPAKDNFKKGNRYDG